MFLIHFIKCGLEGFERYFSIGICVESSKKKVDLIFLIPPTQSAVDFNKQILINQDSNHQQTPQARIFVASYKFLQILTFREPVTNL